MELRKGMKRWIGGALAVGSLLVWSAVAMADANKEATSAGMIATYEQLKTALKANSVDFTKVIAVYRSELEPLAKARDAEGKTPTAHNDELIGAFTAASEGRLPGPIVAQVFDKLMQKVFFQSIRHELGEVGNNWGESAKGLQELEEAKAFYAVLDGTVGKRESAHGVALKSIIQSGFNEMEDAIKKGDQLAFHLGRQLVDKTLMKTFYLAVGASSQGYVYKIEKAVNDGNVAKAQEMQAEAWAFYQSIYGYLRGSAQEDADYIEKKLGLSSDVKEIKAADLNKRFVRAIAKVAAHEYDESFKNWGTQKAAITALEGALFLHMIETDVKILVGDAAYASAVADAQSLFEAVNGGNRVVAESKYRAVMHILNEAAK